MRRESLLRRGKGDGVEAWVDGVVLGKRKVSEAEADDLDWMERPLQTVSRRTTLPVGRYVR